MNFRKWGISFLSLLLAIFVFLGAVTVVIDPFFHYHAPITPLAYELFYQRYQNDGIVKHFDYNAIITGNSLTENFRTSQLEALFGLNAVKIPFSGATPKELDMNNRAGFKANPDIKMLVMNLDYGNFVRDKDSMSYDEGEYPDYLYNSDPFDDVKYFLNKSIFVTSLNVLKNTLAGKTMTSFDDYSFWGNDPNIAYGRDAILASYERPWNPGLTLHLDEERYKILYDNLEQNVLRLVRENPNTEFYLFFPPVSMFFWDKMNELGELEMTIEAEEAVIELLLEYENVHLFSFLDEYGLVTDYSRYKDYIHYNAEVNSWMLECMAAGEHLLTRDNYKSYLEKNREFYTGFDYDSLFES